MLQVASRPWNNCVHTGLPALLRTGRLSWLPTLVSHDPGRREPVRTAWQLRRDLLSGRLAGFVRLPFLEDLAYSAGRLQQAEQHRSPKPRGLPAQRLPPRQNSPTRLQRTERSLCNPRAIPSRNPCPVGSSKSAGKPSSLPLFGSLTESAPYHHRP